MERSKKLMNFSTPESITSNVAIGNTIRKNKIIETPRELFNTWNREINNHVI